MTAVQFSPALRHSIRAFLQNPDDASKRKLVIWLLDYALKCKGELKGKSDFLEDQLLQIVGLLVNYELEELLRHPPDGMLGHGALSLSRELMRAELVRRFPETGKVYT